MGLWAAARRLLLSTACCSMVCAAEGDFEILSHRARLQVFPDANALSCTDTLLIRRTSAARQIRLNLLPVYDVEYLTVKGRKSDVRKTREGLLIDLPSDSSLEIILSYGGRLAFRSEFSSLSPS